jgi:recombination protein RecA
VVKELPGLDQFFEDKTIMFGNDPDLAPVFLSTGIANLDTFLDGGLRRRSMSIFAGMEGQGKTWTSQQFARTSILAGLGVCYMDIEKAYDPKWWKQTGVPVDKLWVAQPGNGEDAIDIMVNLLKQEIDVIILDSLAAMMPSTEGEVSAEQNFMGLQARMNADFYRKANTLNKCTHVMVIQQLREKIGIVYGNPYSIPGGKAKDFFSSSIIQCKRAGWIEENKVRKGFILKYEAMKQRGTANPGDYTEISVLFNGKLDEIGQMIGIAIAAGVIVQEGAWYKIVDKSTGELLANIQGKARISETLEKNEELYKKVVSLIP